MAPRPLPDLLLRFLHWAAAGGWTSDWVEFMSLRGDWLDDSWIEYGSDLSEHFAFFGQLDGDRYGLWFPDGTPAVEEAPVVFVGHEGETPILGRSSLHFLTRLAYDDGLYVQLDGPYRLERYQPFRGDLQAWLVDSAALSAAEASALAAEDPAAGMPDLMSWFRQHQERTRNRVAQDPLLAEVFSVRPSVHAICLADRMELWARPGIEPVPAPEAARLGPLVRQYREARAAVLPGRGGFFSAHLWGHDDGPAPPDCNFEFRPPFKTAPAPTRDDYVADLVAFPRAERWMPDWLIEIVG